MNAFLPILLVLSLLTLIGVRFIPRKGRIKHLWLVCCLCNLAIGAFLAYRSYESSKAMRAVQQSIREMQPFELTQEQRGVLAERFTELIEEEKQAGLEEAPVVFELFPQQSIDAENIVKFIHKIFENAGRKTDISMVYNSGTPTDVRMVMLKIADPLNPPVLLTRFCQIFSDMGIQYKVLISNKVQDRSLVITAQRPVFILPDSK